MFSEQQQFRPSHPYGNPAAKKRTAAKWLLMKFLGLLFFIPLLGHALLRLFTVDCLYVALLHQYGNQSRLYTFLHRILKSGAFRRKGKHHYWWFFMRLIVAFLQEEQIHHFLINPDLEEELITLGKMGPGKRTGYNVAYSFVGFSLWLFERGLIHDAINMVAIAAEADQAWGYPEYLHGWYGLFIGGEGSEQHFTKAVIIDWSFLHRMRRDRTCQQFPDMIKKVSQQVLVSGKKGA